MPVSFPPRRDFRHAQRLLAGIDPSQCPDEFEFGQEGRPLYIRGPAETIDEARIIAARVQALGGENVLPLKLSEAPSELANRAEVTDLEANDARAWDDGPVDRSHMTQLWLRRWLGF